MDSVTAAAAGGGAACATCNHHHEEEDAEAVSKLNQKALHMASSRRSEEDLASARAAFEQGVGELLLVPGNEGLGVARLREWP